MDALHTHTLKYTNTNMHVHKHTDNGSQITAFTTCHGGETAEYTHTPAWVNGYWVLFYITTNQVRE